MKQLIAPHGGKLVQRVVADAKELETWHAEAPRLRSVMLGVREMMDLDLLAVGAMSPLEGFMGEEDYQAVVASMRLASGLPWSIPVTLPVTKAAAETLPAGEPIALKDQDGHILAILDLKEKFPLDREREALEVYRTVDRKHPGVALLDTMGDVLLGGRVTVLRRAKHADYYQRYLLDPKEIRFLFAKKGWRTVVAFQTRNPIHRAHEYIQKCALEIVDGLFLHPLVGPTKDDDVPAPVRLRCYEALLKDYYPAQRTVMAVLPAPMRYAGPREAIFHAILRKNSGCTHMIIGRDHAGVGNFYGSYDAHYIFDEFEPTEIGITPLFFEHSFFCQRCGSMASTKTCPHDSKHHVLLSGTRVRDLLSRGEAPPLELTRPEVIAVMMEAYGPKAKDAKDAKDARDARDAKDRTHVAKP